MYLSIFSSHSFPKHQAFGSPMPLNLCQIAATAASKVKSCSNCLSVYKMTPTVSRAAGILNDSTQRANE